MISAEYMSLLKRQSVNGRCCQESQLQVRAEPGLMVSVTCLVCGRKGPIATTYYEAVRKYREHYHTEQAAKA